MQGTTKAAWLAILVLAVPVARADDLPPGAPPDKSVLAVTEPTAFLAAPDEDAPVIAPLAKGDHLVLITHKQHGEFYRVIRIGRGPVGWIINSKVDFVHEKEDADEEKGKRCAESLAECPTHGCAGPEEPEGLSNARKRGKPEGGEAVVLGLEQYTQLQIQADERVGQGKPQLDAAGRARLKDLELASGKISEGALVRTFGFIPKGRQGLHVNDQGESVNCNIKGKSENDFHIPLVAEPGDSEFQGMVVEMIPQDRPENWNLDKLAQVQEEGREVWVEGGLYYDKSHYVSNDPEAELRNDPNRATLWEIHPVTKFLVCRKERCSRSDESDWEQL